MPILYWVGGPESPIWFEFEQSRSARGRENGLTQSGYFLNYEHSSFAVMAELADALG